MRLIDLTEQRFGRLTVVGRASNRRTSGGHSVVMWNCKCDCGKDCVVSANQLRSGATKSCGCFNIDQIKKRMHERQHIPNKYDLSVEYGIGYLSNGKQFYFDLEDYDKIKDYCWFEHHTGYIVAKDIHNGYKQVYLHKIVFDDGDDYTVDHIGHDFYDCRKEVLREKTHRENNINRPLSKNNKSGVTGVFWHKRDQKWIAIISPENGKHIEVARTTDFDEAVKARKAAEKKYYGEYAYDKSMKYAEEHKIS